MVLALRDIGVSVSYNRILPLDNQLVILVLLHTQQEQVACLPQLCLGLFTVAAVDNINHNPASSKATGSFYGTGNGLFQLPTKKNLGLPIEEIKLPLSNINRFFFTYFQRALQKFQQLN